jgi:WD40 repeat protein
MRLPGKKFGTLFVFLLLSAAQLTAAELPGGHMGAVTALIFSGDRIISAGEDGYVGIWNARLKTAQQRFQLTTYGIKAMVKHPLKDEICIIESGGMGQHGISVWNFGNWEKLFTLRSKEPVTFVNYSAGGSFIITGGYNGEKLALFDSNSGKNIPFQDVLAGIPALAVTGRAERNLLVYQSRHERALAGYGGLISYLDLNSAVETNQFSAPGGLSNPIAFGNNRFLAGINGEGLLVLDASTGTVLDGDDEIAFGALLCPADGEFYCVNREGGDSIMYRLAVDNYGNLITRRRLVLPIKGTGQISLAAAGGSVAFGTEDGEIFLLAENGSAVKMAHNSRSRVTEIATAKDNIAFLTENGELCFLPLNYALLEKTKNLAISDKRGYTMISPLAAADEDQFLLWQTGNTRLVPALVNDKHEFAENRLSSFPSRFPLRSVSSWDSRILFLDSGGNVSVYDLKDLGKNAVFAYSAIGAIDAAFIDPDNFILCRGVIGGNSPFFVVNSRTGETLSVAYPASAGVTAYTGSAGNIYAAAIERDSDGVKTKVFVISASVAGKTILEYKGEDVQLSLAESAGSFAVSASVEEAAIYAEQKTVFERTEGLPVKLSGSPDFFISLDSEGGIAWHDNKTGKVLATFRLYADRWTLTTSREFSGVLSRH